MDVIDYRNTKLVGVNARGYRVGEDHQCAKLSDHEVELIRELADPADGSAPMPYRTIAEKFEISAGMVSEIVNFRKRASFPAGFRRVKITIEGRDLVHFATADGPRAGRSVRRERIELEPADNDLD